MLSLDFMLMRHSEYRAMRFPLYPQFLNRPQTPDCLSIISGNKIFKFLEWFPVYNEWNQYILNKRTVSIHCLYKIVVPKTHFYTPCCSVFPFSSRSCKTFLPQTYSTYFIRFGKRRRIGVVRQWPRIKPYTKSYRKLSQ